MDIDCHYFSFYSISSAHPSINSIHLFYIFPFIYQLIIFFLTTNDSQLKLGSSIIINTYILHFVADHIHLLTFHFISFLWNIILSTVRIYTIYIFISAKCLVLFLIHRSRIPCHFALCDFSLIILVRSSRSFIFFNVKTSSAAQWIEMGWNAPISLLHIRKKQERWWMYRKWSNFFFVSIFLPIYFARFKDFSQGKKKYWFVNVNIHSEDRSYSKVCST